MEFQVAFSNDREGPWSYIGPDGTSGTVFTTSAGEDFDATSDFEGRYARFKAVLSTSDGADTPSFGDVHLSFSGEGMLASEVRTYVYDDAGNIESITTVTDAGSATDVRTHNDLNQIEEQVVGGDTWTFSYDDNGNMTGKTDGTDTWLYSWNDEHRLIRVQGPGGIDLAYTYDSMGRLLTRDEGGPDVTKLTWDHWDCIKEVTGESETVYHIPQGHILNFVRDGVTYQAHSAALGSVRMITDEEGDVAARYDYDAFGTAISATEDSALSGFPMRFVGSRGLRFDLPTGLIYCRQRWYSPQLARFLSPDQLYSKNAYVYVLNKPTQYVDASGQQWSSEDNSYSSSQVAALKSRVRAIFDNPECVDAVFKLRCLLADKDSCPSPCTNKEDLLEWLFGEQKTSLKISVEKHGEADNSESGYKMDAPPPGGTQMIKGSFQLRLGPPAGPGDLISDVLVEHAFHELLHAVGGNHSDGEYGHSRSAIPLYADH